MMGENFSSSGRSNERFAGLMEKIRFPSGYLLFEIWKSEAKKREGERGGGGSTMEGRNGARAGMGESRHEASVGCFAGSSAPFGRVGPYVSNVLWVGLLSGRPNTEERLFYSLRSPHVGRGHSRCTLRAGGSGSPVSDDAMPIPIPKVRRAFSVSARRTYSESMATPVRPTAQQATGFLLEEEENWSQPSQQL